MLPEPERAEAMARVRQLQAQMQPAASAAAGFMPVIGETQSFNDLRRGLSNRDAASALYGLVGMLPLLGGATRAVKGAAKTADAMGDVARGAKAIDAAGDVARGADAAQDATKGFKAYHGSPNSFDRFDFSRSGETTDLGALGKGGYFSTDPRVAQSKKHKYEVEVDLQNPLRAEMPDWRTDKTNVISKLLKLDLSGKNLEEKSNAITMALRARGHDGVILDYAPTGYTEKEIMTMSPDAVRILRKYGILAPVAGGTAMVGMSGDAEAADADLARAMVP